MSANLPLLNQLQKLIQNPDIPFYAPGHKHGKGVSQSLINLLAEKLFQADLPELPELDNLFAPEGVIEEAQNLASYAFGADKTWFLINGSSCGIIASILATCKTGDKIVLPRNVHQSAISGLILSGAIPIFINPEYNHKYNLAYNITPEALKIALDKHPDTKAVFIVSPTYQGICSDIKTIADITHNNHIPLIVDEAHSAHFHFHPDLPPDAISLGADISIQSTHKVLGAISQGSMLHLKGNRVNCNSLNKALQLVQTTSPNYIILASLDAAREQMETEGKKIMERTLNIANFARQELNKIPHISILQDINLPQAGFKYLDNTRLTIFTHKLGISGFELDDLLREEYNITAELPMFKHLAFMITLGNTQKDIESLISAIKDIKPLSNKSFIFPFNFSLFQQSSELTLSPRDAFFATTKVLPLEETIGKISSELICPYPPGIPLLLPGDTIKIDHINYLKQIKSYGGMITGYSDSNFKTLKIIDN